MEHLNRISLAEVSRATGTVLQRGDSRHWQADKTPTLQDLTECLFFSPGDGRIWLHDQRMVLLHGRALGSLRRELIESLGAERARGFLTRAGYVSGVQDAELVRQRWKDADPPSIAAAGTRLHALEGMVKVEPVNFEFDIERGYYEGEFLWHHSIEDDENIKAYGVGTEPACWMQTGYAIGYVSALFGQLVIFREIDCRSMGAPICRVVGKAAERWGDISEDLRYLNAADFASAASATHRSARSVVSFPEPPDESEETRELIGASSAFNAACHALGRVAPTQATVLFSGESGVGKEMFANMLHRISPRKDGPFVALNCAAIPDTLIESELFGVERGAFTGATHSRAGRFERAQGGTLFLDEIGSLSPTGQGKLLRALQEREIERIGSTRAIKVDVRLVAATNIDLREAVKRGQFREDLFFRLNVFPIALPPLRERRDDVPLLANHFLRNYSRKHGRHPSGLTQRALRALLNHDFPGNIRELQNLIERGVIAANDDEPVDLPHLFRGDNPPAELLYSIASSGALSGAPSGPPGDATDEASARGSDSLLERMARIAGTPDGTVPIEQLEQLLMQEAVAVCDGNLAAAARRLGLTRPQLAYRLKQASKRNA